MLECANYLLYGRGYLLENIWVNPLFELFICDDSFLSQLFEFVDDPDGEVRQTGLHMILLYESLVCNALHKGVVGDWLNVLLHVLVLGWSHLVVSHST